ncbi:MAG: iron-sulfur cluster assembly scaffold protein [Armatimonadetes bacterium]|nr:iron-sulfur cluster assembly scaffold protein [Armatimonadota bacterium]
MYSERLIALFRSAKHAGTLEDATHRGEAGTPGRGPYMRLWLRIEQEVVVAARFKTQGCPAAIACGEALCEMAEGQAAEQVDGLTAADLAAYLGGAPEGKEHCPALAMEAWRNARLGGTAAARVTSPAGPPAPG